MTTRKVSAFTGYPFVPTLSEADREIARCVVDLYFVIAGLPDGVNPSSPSPSEGDDGVYLVEYRVEGTVTVFVFHAVRDGRVWTLWFNVPNQETEVGAVKNTMGYHSRAIMVYRGDLVPQSSAYVFLRVEPGRVQWYTEQVNQFEFFNGTTPVLSVSAPVDEDIVLPLGDGINCAVTYDDALRITGGPGEGQGHPEAEAAEESVLTVNGLTPRNGDIPVETSTALGIQREEGILRVILTNQSEA